MSLTSLRVCVRSMSQTSYVNRTLIRCYAKSTSSTAAGGIIPALGKKGKVSKGPSAQKKEISVCEDPHHLVNYCAGSCINVEGEDVKLQDDSEYPDWLWELNIGAAPKLEEMDRNTHAYWARARKEALKRNNRLNKLKKF